MTNKLSPRFSGLGKAGLGVVLVSGVWAQPAWASPAASAADSARPGQHPTSGGTNLSGNPFDPLVPNAKWTYDYTVGKTSFTLSETVAGSRPTSSGTQVTVNTTSSLLPRKVTPYAYTIEHGGAVEVETSPSSGASFSTGYWTPTASQIETCAACKFSGPFSSTISGQSEKGTLSETATALGPHTVTVPAGTFSTEEVKTIVGMHAIRSQPMTMSLTIRYFFAKNVGVVETIGGNLRVTVTGQSVTTPLGSEKLESYKP